MQLRRVGSPENRNVCLAAGHPPHLRDDTTSDQLLAGRTLPAQQLVAGGGIGRQLDGELGANEELHPTSMSGGPSMNDPTRAHHAHGDHAHGFALELIGEAAPAALDVELTATPEFARGEFVVELDPASATVSVRGGDRAGVLYGARLVPELVARGETAHVHQRPALAHRLLWTWDHSTNWELVSIGRQESGAFNGYEKQPEAFVDGYRRLVDFASAQRLDGVIVYGLLRDGHGGVAAAKDLCAYACERGVKLIAGIAANAYGGIYYEGNHPHNLSTWLDAHPELEARYDHMPGFHIPDYGRVPFPAGPLTRAGDSGRVENLDWTLDGIEWLIETIEPGGVNVEFGDYAGNDALADMKRILPAIVERVGATRPGLPVYTDVGWDQLADPAYAAKLDGLPDGCIYAFTFNRRYWPTLRDGLTEELVDALPGDDVVLRGQIATQWNRERHAYVAPDLAAQAQLARTTGLGGVCMFGEASDFDPLNELNYIAFARFGFDATMTWERFVDEVETPLLGDHAADYISMARAAGVGTGAPTTADIAALVDRAFEIHASTRGHVRRRWTWLTHRLGELHYLQRGPDPAAQWRP